jgi:hypothetical protein
MSAETPHHNGCTLDVYAQAVGLSAEWLETARVRQVRRAYRPAVAVTHYSLDGAEDGHSICRAAPDVDTDGVWDHKSVGLPFGVHTVTDQKPVYLVDSIVGAQTLHFHGLPAVAAPDMSRSSALDALLTSAPMIVVVVQASDGELTAPKWMGEAPWRDRALLLGVAHSRSLNALHQADQEQFSAALAQMTSTATSWQEYEDRRAKAIRDAALDRCRDLAGDSDILARVGYEAHAGGYAGDTRPVLVVFLALVSCLLERPVSIVLKGVSSAGKSFAVTTALKFVPPTAYYTLTSMSERALIYDNEPLRHRALVLYEADGLGGFAEVIVRSLLSEDHIVYKTVQDIEGTLETVTIEREGPTGLITTTTSVKLHHENETRLLSDTVPDTSEQTGLILEAEAARAEGIAVVDIDYSEYHALYEFLAASHEAVVVVPFARMLAAVIPRVAVRLRRDFKALLSLIMAHTLLHQQTREHDAQGRVIATLDDYTAVYRLVACLFSEGVERTVPPSVSETVRAVGDMGQPSNTDGDGVTLNQIRHKLRSLGVELDRSAVLRRVNQAIERGYLVDLAGGQRGKPKRIVIGEVLGENPGETDVLPTPDVLGAL